MKATVSTFQLNMIHPFGISRGTSTSNTVFYLQFEGGGTGEGACVSYKGQKLEDGVRLVAQMAEGVTESNLFDLDHHAKRAREIAPNHSAARAAFDIALHDRIGQRLGIPVHSVAGFGPATGATSSFTISLESDEKMVAKTHEAAGFPHLKIKLGRDDWQVDKKTLTLIREAAPNKVIRVDANAGWSLETGRKMVKVCADLGIEFIEAPLKIGNIEETGILKKESPLPIIADEDVQDAKSLPALVGKVDGINIKLMKCGGLWEARQMIGFARSVGWQVMYGCMIESSISIAAAAHLAASAECLDLDTELLVANNPCGPHDILQKDGTIKVPTTPGLGVYLKKQG